ncbi:MAG: methenyltetrahydromethanopterin cyclohydrolase [Planctomycetaceae bacterium]|nr:methenyltetrahydromethanopterin cyclohydrolase [Planctomycetales bacterium]MCB9927688.1 methenyltetrahydromethanopterin cyclohydrolase [Planctomycetaceae bacterium]
MNLNQLALARCEQLVERATQLRIAVLRDETGARIIDCGVHVPGGLEAGVGLAEVCMAGLGRVELTPGNLELWPGPSVAVRTDQPVAACMASQYAGWQIAGEKFFAMGSGPMRAIRGRETLFEKIGFKEAANAVIGILETAKLPHEDVCHHVAEECGIAAEHLTLMVAPTASLAGSIQVVARSIETALHKLHEVGFDIQRVRSGFGVAPLPPIAADDLVGIGRTNDAVLYGGEVTLWVTGDDDSLREFGPQIPSSASPDHGQPFAAIFDRYERDFYKIDPMLFSPARVVLNNLDTGTAFRFGETDPQVIHESFTS